VSNGFGNFTFFNKGDSMKNFVIALMIVVGMVSSVYAGECANGVCSAPLVRPVRKVVNITKEVVVAPVRAVVAIAPVRSVVAIATPNRCCTETVATDCCGSTTKEVVKYQPVRRRLVNRTTVVAGSCNCQ
jgi:hypothetical protein